MRAVTPTISIATPWGEATITVEVVTTRPEIERGLMYRDHLPYDAGMLFLMGSDAVWSFYMRSRTSIVRANSTPSVNRSEERASDNNGSKVNNNPTDVRPKNKETNRCARGRT